MQPNDEVQDLIEQDLAQKNYSGDIELQKALKTAHLGLVNALRSNLESHKPELSETVIQERIESILSLLEGPIKNLPTLTDKNVDEFRERLRALVELHHSMQPKMISKAAKIGLFSNPREQMKAMLNTVGINLRETIDPYIEDYLTAQRDVLANHVAVHNALEQADRINQLRSKYPDGQVEIIILKRHEVCSDLHKGLGFNPDTGLDALHFQKGQSAFELTTSKSVQNQQLLIMRKLGLIDRVEMTVSPVTRAYETALHATFSPDLVDSVTVDNHFAEAQMNTVMVSSGRAYRFASDVAKDFIQAGYKDVRAQEDFLIPGENKISFFQRRNEACKRMLFHHETEGVTMKIIVGHGGMNNGLIDRLKTTIKDNNIPNARRKLDFGGQYNLIIVRDENQRIITLDDGGKTNRYGLMDKTLLVPVGDLSVEQYLDDLDISIEKEKSEDRKAMLLFRRCMVEPKPKKLPGIINENIELMLDKLPLFAYETLDEIERVELILHLLLETQYDQLEKRINKENTSLGSWISSAVTNYASGKYPDEQRKVLDKLRAVDNNEKPEVVILKLEAIVKEAEITCKEGKVTNLCRAKLNLEKWRGQFTHDETNDNNLSVT